MSVVTVSVNGLSLVHENSGGISTATLPDVCCTPPTQGPVPYPNVARSRDLTGGSVLVRADGGNSIATAGSAFARSSGGEPGTGGGVTSGTSGGAATFLSHSFDVSVEGRGACRLTDKMLHNDGNTVDCAGVVQMPLSRQSRGPRRGTGPRMGLDRARGAERVHWFGVDTNLAGAPPGATLDLAFAKSKGCRFVGRYISDNGERLPNGTPAHPRLTRAEVAQIHGAGMKVFAIWEITKYRPEETFSVAGQRHLGKVDARAAKAWMRSIGAPRDKPVYFTVDYGISLKRTPGDTAHHAWREKVKDTKTNKWIRYKELILAYFDGIISVMGVNRTGCYGTYVTINQLFNRKKIRYGWQMVFNDTGYERLDQRRIDPRAQLHQYNIYPSQAGLGVGGAGGLDFDMAVNAEFGQW